ncbi:MAG: CBS domain-containing protein [Bacilli bacterium]|jgi:CBS domain-containing protein
MNILFFLIPKSQVAYVIEDFTLRQVAEKLTYHHYTAIPILSKDGHYIGTVSEGDLFRYIKDHDQLNYHAAENTPILDVPIEREVEAIRFDAKMEDLYHLALNQNFVPVLDDSGIFIGIVTRSDIIGYFCHMNDDSKKI